MDCVKQQDNFEKLCGHNKERTFWIHSSPADPCMLFKEITLEYA